MVRGDFRRRRASSRFVLVFVAAGVAAALSACSPEAPTELTPTASPTVSVRPTGGPSATQLEGTPTPRPSVSPSPGHTPVAVVLATWGVDSAEVSASAYVSGVIEEGGACTIHVQSSQGVAEKVRDAQPTGQNTSCGFLSVPLAEAGPAPWVVWITYESSASAGASEQVELSQESGR